jgi:hypothetical protein
VPLHKNDSGYGAEGQEEQQRDRMGVLAEEAIACSNWHGLGPDRRRDRRPLPAGASTCDYADDRN